MPAVLLDPGVRADKRPVIALPYTQHMAPADRTRSLPYIILALLLAVWVSLGVWICLAAPYGSGTDESIRYVAFTAATNRWATAEDAAVYGVDSFYYPPLYFLLFAPFFGNEPAFTTAYPSSPAGNSLVVRFNGGSQLVPGEYLRRVPPQLLQLYRSAKMVSLLFGVGIIVCLMAALRLLFPGPDRPWLVLGGTAPVLLLPQFLYYHTLVNNDPLVNFLCAAAILSFIAAVQASGRGDGVGVRSGGIVCAAATGLGLLTKQSAIVVSPLLIALAWLEMRSGASPGEGRRLAPALRRLALLTAVAFAAGGWWLLRSALSADLTGMRAQRLGHPWAFTHTNFSWDFLVTLIGAAARSSVALFAGMFSGIPDRIFMMYLVVAFTLGAAFVGALFIRRLKRASPAFPAVAPRLVWAMLAATLSVNLIVFVWYNLDVAAPHGRLFFPSLIASSAFLALVLHTIAGRSRRLLVALVCLLTACLGGLFLWVFAYRMVAAVTQPDENLVPLGVTQKQLLRTSPLWDDVLEQPLLLPPGRLTGFRLQVYRSSYLPQLGAVINARLRTFSSSSDIREHRFQPSSVGDNRPDGWTDIVLETPLELPGTTSALLQLVATKPWFALPGFAFNYGLTPLDYSPLLRPLIINGRPSQFGLSITAVSKGALPWSTAGTPLGTSAPPATGR